MVICYGSNIKLIKWLQSRIYFLTEHIFLASGTPNFLGGWLPVVEEAFFMVGWSLGVGRASFWSYMLLRISGFTSLLVSAGSIHTCLALGQICCWRVPTVFYHLCCFREASTGPSPQAGDPHSCFMLLFS